MPKNDTHGRRRAVNGSGLQPRLRKDGLWEVRYSVGYDPGTGKPIRKSIYGKTAAEVAEKLRAITAQIDAKTYFEPEKMPLHEWLDIWLQDYCGGVKPGTVKTYSDSVKNHIKPGLGAVRLSELNPHQVQHFINSLSTKKISVKTIKNIHGVLSKALSEAVRVRYIASNPANGCILPKAPKVEINPLNEEEIALFMQGIQGDRYESLFFVALNTGMRLSELLGLRWSKVDFKTGFIKVDTQLLVKRGKDYNRELAPTKNNKPRSFKPARAVMQELIKVHKTQAEWKLQAGHAFNNSLDLVFTDELGREIPHATIEHRFTKILNASDLAPHRFHDLRHTFTVEALKAGIDVKTVSEMLGHSSVSFTMDVYAHVTNEMQDSASRRLDELISRRG